MNTAENVNCNNNYLPVDAEHSNDDATSELNTRFFNSLRFKGYVFIALLLSCIAVIAVFVLSQRHEPLDQLEQYQKIQKAQQALIQADLAAFHVVTVLFSDVTQTELREVVGYFSTLREQYQNLQILFPEQAESFRKLVESIPITLEDPNKSNLQQIHFHLASSKNELDRLMSINRDRMTKLVEDYRIHNDSIVVTTLTLGIMSLALLGAITTLFFNQLKSDLKALQERTTEIVDGYRGAPLLVKRRDEVGQLTHGVNVMAQALAEREQALEIQHRKSSFMEKMVAIDSLAGGIAHEIGNPISCIAGLAQEVQSDEQSKLSSESQKSLNILLKYIDGLVGVTRDLSVIDTQNTDEYEWLDINQLITNTCNIYRYDKRWVSTGIKLELDYDIPALLASNNQISQLITNILENALDAVATMDQPVITLQTLAIADDILNILVTDNGPGIDTEVLPHIFDPFYSTKPVGQGTGLGLAICWSIVKTHHGTITAESHLEQGTTIKISLPVNYTGDMA